MSSNRGEWCSSGSEVIHRNPVWQQTRAPGSSPTSSSLHPSTYCAAVVFLERIRWTLGEYDELCRAVKNLLFPIEFKGISWSLANIAKRKPFW